MLFTPAGLRVRSIATKKNSTLSLNIKASGFEDYTCNQDKIIGVNTSNLYKMIKRIDTDEILVLTLRDNEPNFLRCLAVGQKIRFNDKIRLTDIDFNNFDLVRGEAFTVHFRTNGKFFQKLCRNLLDTGGERVEITAVKNEIKLRCKTEQLDREIGITDDTETSTKITNDTPSVIVNGTFNLKQIMKFSKCFGFSEEVRLHLGNNNPVIVEYDVSNIGVISLAVE